jgi:hypothetical protein
VSVRLIIVLLALPLFLLLAAVNSLLLYQEETREMAAGLRGQALAAAVTVAEFAKASSDPFTDLVQPHRYRALHSGTRGIVGLDALYLVRPGRPPLDLIDRPLSSHRQGIAPAKPALIGPWRNARGHLLITALAPAGKGDMVVADVDADPLGRRALHLERLSIALVVGSAALAILLGLIIARRVIGEFRRTRAIIEARGGGYAGEQLGIQEVRDLADAIHLIDASVASELQRLGAAGKGDLAIGVAAERGRYFPNVSDRDNGMKLSIRMLANAPAGCFHVRKEESGYLVFGEMEGEPAEAFAAAVALSNYVLAGAPEEFDRRVDAACQAFGCTQIVRIAYGDAPQSFGLNGNAAAMRDYGERNPDLDPDALTEDMTILFPNAGIVGAVRSA